MALGRESSPVIVPMKSEQQLKSFLSSLAGFSGFHCLGELGEDALDIIARRLAAFWLFEVK